MHTWVRRGLRTAFVTGGLLMLGTGIASADENVSPDLPPGPVDAGISSSVDTGHVSLDKAMHRDVRGAVARKAATPSLTAAGAPARKVASRINPLVRQAQPVARRVDGRRGVDRGDVLSGILTTAHMAGLGRTAVPDSVTVPGGVSRTQAHIPMAGHRSSVPQNAVLSGVPVVPSIKGVGLLDVPEAQPVQPPLVALPGAPTFASVSNEVSRVSPRLPATYGAEAPTSAVPTRQTRQLLDHSPLDSLPRRLSVGRVGGVSRTQDEVPHPAVRALDARSVGLPPEAALPTEPTVGQVVDSASSEPVTDVAGPPSALVQSLEASSVPVLPSLPTVPKIAPEAMLQGVEGELSHVEVHPAETRTATVRTVRALDRSPLGAQPRMPELPSVPDVSSAPAARSLVDTVPVTQAAVVPVTAASTTALPSPVADLVQPLGQSTLAALPGAPMVQDGVTSLLSRLPVTRPAEAPSSARHDIEESALGTAPLRPGLLDNLQDEASSPLPTVQGAEVPFSVPNRPSFGQVTDALPDVSSPSEARGVVNKAASHVPVVQAVVLPASAIYSSALVSSTDQGVRSDAGSALDLLPGVSPVAAAESVPQVTGVPASVRNSVNESPLGALPGVPTLPSVPAASSIGGSAVDVASSPTHVTKLAEVPVSDVNTANLPSAPVESVSYSPAGRMFGVPTIREAATTSLAAVPVEQMARTPGTISRSINESPFASLPGDPRVPTVPSVPELAVRTSSRPPVSYATGSASSIVHATQVFGKPAAALPGVSDGDSIAGVLPVVQDLFPRI